MGKEDLVAKGWQFVQDIPFDSERKRMSVVYHIQYIASNKLDNKRYKSPNGTTIAFSKGAAEQLLPQCAAWVHYEGDNATETQMSQAVCLWVNNLKLIVFRIKTKSWRK